MATGVEVQTSGLDVRSIRHSARSAPFAPIGLND